MRNAIRHRVLPALDRAFGRPAAPRLAALAAAAARVTDARAAAIDAWLAGRLRRPFPWRIDVLRDPSGLGQGLRAALLLTAIAFAAFRREIRSPMAATVALLLGASFSQYVLATSLNNETPYALLLVALVWGTGKFVDRPSWLLAAGLGVVHGAASLLRPEHPLVVILLVGYMLLAAWRSRNQSKEEPGASLLPRVTS